jgi:hypothetical protein
MKFRNKNLVTFIGLFIIAAILMTAAFDGFTSGRQAFIAVFVIFCTLVIGVLNMFIGRKEESEIQ